MPERGTEKFGAFASVTYIQEAGVVQITRTSSIGMITPECSLLDVANGLLGSYGGIPLVCDRKTADELAKSSITWLAEDHYQLQGLSRGVLEVYAAYQADQLSLGNLPSGVVGIQIFRE